MGMPKVASQQGQTGASATSLNLYFHAAIIALFYTANNIALLVSWAEGLNKVYHHDLHMLEFWGTFLFCLLQVYLTMYTAAGSDAFRKYPYAIHVVTFLMIVMSLTAALLITIDLKTFGKPAHQIEYTNEITIAFMDLTLLLALMKTRGATVAQSVGQVISVLVAIAVAVAQLLLFNVADDGPRLAHFLEFSFETFSGIVTFFFCMKWSMDQTASAAAATGVAVDDAADAKV